jgi:hypothetical protein
MSAVPSDHHVRSAPASDNSRPGRHFAFWPGADISRVSGAPWSGWPSGSSARNPISKAIHLVFGKPYGKPGEPGLHCNLPSAIGDVVVVNVQDQRRVANRPRRAPRSSIRRQYTLFTCRSLGWRAGLRWRGWRGRLAGFQLGQSQVRQHAADGRRISRQFRLGPIRPLQSGLAWILASGLEPTHTVVASRAKPRRGRLNASSNLLYAEPNHCSRALHPPQPARAALNTGKAPRTPCLAPCCIPFPYCRPINNHNAAWPGRPDRTIATDPERGPS